MALSAVEINGEAAPGVSSGEAMQEIEKLAAQLPPGYSVDWAGESYQERAAGAQTPAALHAFDDRGVPVPGRAV